MGLPLTNPSNLSSDSIANFCKYVSYRFFVLLFLFFCSLSFIICYTIFIRKKKLWMSETVGVWNIMVFFLDLFIYVDLSKPKKKTLSFNILNLLSGIILWHGGKVTKTLPYRCKISSIPMWSLFHAKSKSENLAICSLIFIICDKILRLKRGSSSWKMFIEHNKWLIQMEIGENFLKAKFTAFEILFFMAHTLEFIAISIHILSNKIVEFFFL